MILSVGTEQVSDAVTVLALTGEMDRDSSDVLGEAADVVLHGGCTQLVLDLSRLTFCDSSGLNLMFRLHRRLAALGGALYVAAAQGVVLRSIEVVNLSRAVGVHLTVADAVSAASV
ncbi:STAS domain-containing protein [Actinoplanes siamensis]|uniref:Anti-sigma factor antagonist n=1 Tax=Actinoplanes siamensis TaxID=1223317 RepID=A0A919N616_9ACTN|nr:STAS domain-containing protein [Actinoplanes siamensis]GIF05027.1 anti-sigma factor antagonist [Actinoplanes siamensis]